ncbi:uncharacterized protein VP01_1903g1 [Puccinia sorghi]|uniref:Retrotransposon gag domain-containing protein n=1 Tax=Puccinia sorghi TaxID=27349 RepID=A0A0L6VCT7_9BASI|nr:uncharacterized protein VP01_1903g1 [Puccinia sorghi]
MSKRFGISQSTPLIILYSYKTGRVAQWFKPYLDLLNNDSPTCLINNWDKFEQQLFILFGNPNEVQNAKIELNSLSMKDNSKASTHIAQFPKLQSHVDWNDTPLLFIFNRAFSVASLISLH